MKLQIGQRIVSNAALDHAVVGSQEIAVETKNEIMAESEGELDSVNA